MKDYHPPQEVLEKYADVLITFAARNGKGLRKGDVVQVVIPEYAKPLLVPLEKAILQAGGHYILTYLPDNTGRAGIDRTFFENAKQNQINFFPEKYFRGMVDEIDHILFILCETNPQSLRGIDPKKLMDHERAYKKWKDWRFEKVGQGKLSWCLALYGAPGMAKEARLSPKEYWNQIIKACYLDTDNPIIEWKNAFKKINEYQQKLNTLPIEKLHILGPDVDLWITLGQDRKWLGGSGNNIPSFEIFTSPDWRGTDGWIRFNQPLYRYGNLIEGIELEFKKGKVVKAKAKKNVQVLKSMIASPNADKIGEFSLTDGRLSRITKFMAETLFDENRGGPQGNTHIALGSAYHDTYSGDSSKHFTKADWERLGFNDSAVHTDIISTAPRRVMAYLRNGAQKLIYENGRFTI
jgi:aminopeptidase